MRTPEQIEALKAEVAALKWWHSIDLGDGIVTPGTEPSPRSRDAYLNIPEDLTGLNVLDIGAWDGLYSFVAEERGAERVVALDLWDGVGSSSWSGVRPNSAGIELARNARESKIELVPGTVYKSDIWQNVWDVVFFFGVLYHLEDPMLALRAIHIALKPGGLLILETDTSTEIPPLMEFKEHGHHGDETNVWYPTLSCVDAMLRKVGFDPKHQGGSGTRAAWHARKI